MMHVMRVLAFLLTMTACSAGRDASTSPGNTPERATASTVAVATASLAPSATATQSSASASSAAPSASATPSASSEKLVQDEISFAFGTFPRKLTPDERKGLETIWLLVDRGAPVTLLAHSPTKQNANAWLQLMSAEFVALGVDEKQLTKLACVDPARSVVMTSVRKSPATCAESKP